jgi:hypothetical protein
MLTELGVAMGCIRDTEAGYLEYSNVYRIPYC